MSASELAAKFLVVQGRGNVGKTTLLRVIFERASDAHREVTLVDIDRATGTLSKVLEDVQTPSVMDDYSVTEWLHDMVNGLVTSRTSVALDIGGGDPLFGRFASDVGLVSVLTEASIQPVSLWVLSPDTAELAAIMEANTQGFYPAGRVGLVLNAAMVPLGQPADAAFAAVKGHKFYRALIKDGAVEVVFPRLGCMNRVNAAGMTFRRAVGDVSFGITYSQMVRTWRRVVDAALAPIGEWLP